MKEKSIPKPYLALNTVLNEGRFRVDALLSDNDIVSSYAGYDIFREKEVVIRELFPVSIVQRNPGLDQGVSIKLMSDEALFRSMKSHVMARAKKLIGLYPLENAAGILSFFEENGTVYVIEETMQGLVSLDTYMKKRHSAKFTVEDLMGTLKPLFTLLKKLHGKGLWHGSINPETIMITPQRTPYLTHFADPVEDVADQRLQSPRIKPDGFAPVELYVDDAKRGKSTDIFGMGAVFYRYVTGQELPAYYERVNGDKEVPEPKSLPCIVMDFQSDAIMKAVGLYDFDRYESLDLLYKDLCPDDMDLESLHSPQEEARHFKKLPFWYRRELWARRWYLAAVLALAVIFLVLFIPRAGIIIKDLRINSFYKKFNSASDYDKCVILAGLNEKQRTLFTNDFMDLPDDLEDEERAKLIIPKYYDYQLRHYVEAGKVDTNRQYYDYMKIDYLLGKAWVTHMSNEGSVRWEISLKPDMSGAYTIHSTETDRNGKQISETITAKP